MMEGVSFLLLLGVAMPLKYAFGLPLAVKVAGWAHGVLFIALCALLASAYGDRRLSGGLAGLCFVAALLPFGPFVMDRKLRELDVPSRGLAPEA